MRFLLIFLAFCSFALGQKVSSVATLLSENAAIAPNESFTLALKLEHPEEWHSYYQNSGGVELPPTITWKLPEGATAGPIQWPTPEAKEGFSGKSFIYSGSPVFLIDITPPPSLRPGDDFTLTASATWQICKTSCINESAEFTITLPVSEKPEADPAQTEFFQTARRAIPADPAPSIQYAAKTSGKTKDAIELRFTKLDPEPTEFIPNEPYIKALSDGGEVSTSGEFTIITLLRKKIDFLDNPIPQGETVSGILFADKALAIPETTINADAQPAPNAPVAISIGKLLPILGGMFLGGLILNLMPCVFPVIGLKIMGFVQQAGENRRSIALHGLTFALGVMASFAVISGILFAVRAAALRDGGESIGWGYQLQNPWVVLVLTLLMFVLGLNMFGLFEVGTAATSVGGNLQSKSGHSGSFFSGVLATVVATPCSAPFLGAAIGAAIALPAIQFFSAFGAMALGLATPYLVLSFFPSLVEMLPRPGAWMESFKQGMSFLLFATAGYLLWVYSGLIGQEYLLSPLLGLSLIAAAAWTYGRWNLPHKSKRTRGIALAITAVFSIAGILLALPPKPNKLWQPWSEARAQELLSEGTPVYIDFTAQWCLTCQVNKKVAYTEEVLKLAKQKKIVFLKGDKTRPDPAIEAKLQELGRSAIPVNVLLRPGEEPIVTPEVLTPQILKELFNQVP
ncbi:protein-disulfide reductase DsbD family protein [Luteolibacter algae]|uniref:Protein-disulfide reductase DsbD family protein n=1 Tax=Luteolibacter algae TaxID=454151 RepID=A0ABW5D818_9BACT